MPLTKKDVFCVVHGKDCKKPIRELHALDKALSISRLIELKKELKNKMNCQGEGLNHCYCDESWLEELDEVFPDEVLK